MEKLREPGAITNRLKHLRKTEDLTQLALANRLKEHIGDIGHVSEVALTTVGSYETITSPKPYYLALVLTAFPNLSPDWLLLGVYTSSFTDDPWSMDMVASPPPSSSSRHLILLISPCIIGTACIARSSRPWLAHVRQAIAK